MLRPRIFDIKKEEHIPSKAARHRIADLCSSAIPFLVELKWIGSRGTWKRKIDEIYVDIQTYAKHPAGQMIFFLIVDNVRDIQDPRRVERELTSRQTVDGREIDIEVFVCDT